MKRYQIPNKVKPQKPRKGTTVRRKNTFKNRKRTNEANYLQNTGNKRRRRSETSVITEIQAISRGDERD